MWIKICGMTTPQAVEAALAARVDAIGFVFADSPRQVTPAEAIALAAPARGRARCVAVMRHASQRHLDDILDAFRPDVLQADADDLRQFSLPRELERLPVFRGEASQGNLPARLLFEGPRSGSGTLCDWTIAQRVARRTQLVLAGGLDAMNVAAAISAVQPFGVDVSSGVEARPGVKSPEEITRFAAAARSAFEMMQQEPESA